MISPQKSKFSGKQIKSNNILRSLLNIHGKKKKKPLTYFWSVWLWSLSNVI